MLKSQVDGCFFKTVMFLLLAFVERLIKDWVCSFRTCPYGNLKPVEQLCWTKAAVVPSANGNSSTSLQNIAAGIDQI